MTNSSISNLKDSEILKKLWKVGNKHIVVIDESIIQKLGINDDSMTFLKQELKDDGILMRIKVFSSLKRSDSKNDF